MFVILKPFRAGGAFYNPTDPPIDGSQFRNLKQLIDQRYIAPVEHTRRGPTPDPAGAGPVPPQRREQDGTVKPSHETRAKHADQINPDAPQSKASGDGGDKGETSTSGNGEQTAGDDNQPAETFTDADELPAVFPCKEQLADAGVKTFGDLRAWLDSEPREHIDGIGDKRLEHIKEALEALDAGDAPAESSPTDGGAQ